MTEEQIESTVQSWCNNLGIFEIYEELRYMPRDEQEALLTHAFNEWNHQPMLDLLKELAYHFGIYRLDKVVDEDEIITYGDKKLKEMLDNATEN